MQDWVCWNIPGKKPYYLSLQLCRKDLFFQGLSTKRNTYSSHHILSPTASPISTLLSGGPPQSWYSFGPHTHLFTLTKSFLTGWRMNESAHLTQICCASHWKCWASFLPGWSPLPTAGDQQIAITVSLLLWWRPKSMIFYYYPLNNCSNQWMSC